MVTLLCWYMVRKMGLLWTLRERLWNESLQPTVRNDLGHFALTSKTNTLPIDSMMEAIIMVSDHATRRVCIRRLISTGEKELLSVPSIWMPAGLNGHIWHVFWLKWDQRKLDPYSRKDIFGDLGRMSRWLCANGISHSPSRSSLEIDDWKVNFLFSLLCESPVRLWKIETDVSQVFFFAELMGYGVEHQGIPLLSRGTA